MSVYIRVGAGAGILSTRRYSITRAPAYLSRPNFSERVLHGIGLSR